MCCFGSDEIHDFANSASKESHLKAYLFAYVLIAYSVIN